MRKLLLVLNLWVGALALLVPNSRADTIDRLMFSPQGVAFAGTGSNSLAVASGYDPLDGLLPGSATGDLAGNQQLTLTSYDPLRLARISGNTFAASATIPIVALLTGNESTALTGALDNLRFAQSLDSRSPESLSEALAPGADSSGAEMGRHNRPKSQIPIPILPLPLPTTPTPEPASLLLLGSGLVAIGGALRRQRTRN